MTAQRWLALYLGLPIALALFNGLRGTVFAPEIGVLRCTVMFLACSIPTYAGMAVLAHAVLRVRRYVAVHPLLALAVSAAASIPISYVVITAFIRMFDGFYPELQPLLAADGLWLADGFVAYLLTPSRIVIAPIWLGAHYIYESLTRDVLFYEGIITSRTMEKGGERAPAVAPNALPFLTKLKPSLGRRVLALEAQEHYVKVYTDRGEDLILYRLGDAVRELAHAIPGLRVHRSYWVAEDAIEKIQPTAKSYKIGLANGLIVPVSKSYKNMIDHMILNRPALASYLYGEAHAGAS